MTNAADQKTEDLAAWCECCHNFAWDCPVPNRPSDRLRRPKYDLVLLVRASQEIENSGASGCSYCCLLYEAMLHHVGMADKIKVRIWRHGLVEAIYASDKRQYHCVQFYSPLGERPAWNGILTSAEISDSPMSPEAWAFLERCLSTCRLSHKRCNRADATLPTRLLDIGSTNNSRITLCEPPKRSTGVYAALSYCWGGSGNIKTTMANLESMKAGITQASLPKTMQDAVYVARRLGIQYLWVDSLCIIQDSVSDWELESSRMASIYENAFITIAAAASSSASAGFLERSHNTGSSRPKTLVLPWCTDSGAQTVVKSRHIDYKWHMSRTSRCPLRARGWTLQEEILPARLILFCMSELEWKCQELKTCECHCLDSDPVHYGLPSIQASLIPEDFFTTWRTIVENYCGRRLTDPQDRLPALSGVASIVQSATKSPYVAGTWIDDCHHELGWRLDGSCLTFAPATQTPTFSWVSVFDNLNLPHKGYWFPIHFSTGDAKVDAEVISDVRILRWECQPTGLNPFGAVQKAWIELEGHLTSSHLRTTGQLLPSEYERLPVYFIDFFGEERQFTPDVFLEEFSVLSHPNGTSEKSVRRAHPWPKRADFKPINAPVFLLSLSKQILAHSSRRFWLFLVLGRSSRHADCYERLGALNVSYEPEADWLASLGTGLSTVTLV